MELDAPSDAAAEPAYDIAFAARLRHGAYADIVALRSEAARCGARLDRPPPGGAAFPLDKGFIPRIAPRRRRRGRAIASQSSPTYPVGPPP
jgi:hypothetical protein